MCMGFCGCSGPNADMTEENITETVNTVVTALQEFDTEKLNKYVDSSTLDIIIGYAEKHTQFADLGRAIFKNLEVEIQSIDVENRTVTLLVSNKDMEKTASDFAKKLKESYSTIRLLQLLSDNDFLDKKLNQLCNEIDNDEIVSSPYLITLEIVQGKKNLVLSFDTSAENAVSGGALGAIKKIYS